MMMFGSVLRSDFRERGAPTPDTGDLPASVRVDARLKLHVDFHAGATRLTERREEGAFRFRFPHAHGRAPEAILVNMAGGLAGGDRVRSEIVAGEGAALSLTSAAAERIYRSAGATTMLSATLNLAERATVIWLPQETILHDGARVERRFTIDIASRASLVFGEMLFFGRRASGEGYGLGALRESWRVRHGGKLILADETRLGGDFSADIQRPAALGDHVGLATLLFMHPHAGEHLDAIRAALPDSPGLECGASNLGGMIFIRMASPDTAQLRRRFVQIAETLVRRVAQPMPRAMMN